MKSAEEALGQPKDIRYLERRVYARCTISFECRYSAIGVDAEEFLGTSCKCLNRKSTKSQMAKIHVTLSRENINKLFFNNEY